MGVYGYDQKLNLMMGGLNVCDNPDFPVIAQCACGAYFRSCDYIDAMLHITPKSSESHKWTALKGNSFVAGRDGKIFKKQIFVLGYTLKQWREGE